MEKTPKTSKNVVAWSRVYMGLFEFSTVNFKILKYQNNISINSVVIIKIDTGMKVCWFSLPEYYEDKNN